MSCLVSRVSNSGFQVPGVVFGIPGERSRDWGLRDGTGGEVVLLRLSLFGFRVSAFGFLFSCFGFRVHVIGRAVR